MTDKKICGDLVCLKSLDTNDQKQINQWNKDTEVTKYREVDWLRDQKLSSINFGIYDQKSLKLIGDIGIDLINLQNKHAEIGMAIGDKNYWDKGYGTDLVKTILRFCFEELGLNKVYLDVWEENKRAIGCYLKCGFKKDGVLREHVFRDGKYHNKWIMSVLKKEWGLDENKN
jgi:RimJ/RimL family protein N-acetyltransferase